MRSLLVVDRYMPHNGGSRRYYHELALRLPDVAVLTGHQPGEQEFDAASGVVTLRRKGIRPNYAVPADRIKNPLLNLLLAYLPGMAATIFWTFLEVARHRPKVIHAGGYAFAGLAAMVVAPLFRIPYLVFAHGEDVSSTKGRRLFEKLMCRVYQRAQKVVVNCMNTAALVRTCGVSLNQIIVANPGVDDKWLDNSPSPDSDGFKNKKEPTLLSVGRLVPHKGHATVLKSLPRLLKSWPGLKWVLVGAGPEENHLKNLARELGVARSVIFLSGLSDNELRKCYEEADLFVQPNGEAGGAFEGYGMVFLEAGASGLAVIGGRHGGVPEAVHNGETGLLAPPFDAITLTDMACFLLENHTLRNKMGQNGRCLALARSWDRTLSSVVDHESALLEKSA